MLGWFHLKEIWRGNKGSQASGEPTGRKKELTLAGMVTYRQLSDARVAAAWSKQRVSHASRYLGLQREKGVEFKPAGPGKNYLRYGSICGYDERELRLLGSSYGDYFARQRALGRVKAKCVSSLCRKGRGLLGLQNSSRG